MPGRLQAPSPPLVALAGRPVPRYTSYPTAPHFHAGVDQATYRRWLGELSPCASLSVYLHVPFCAAMCAYCGCHTKVTRREQPVEQYRDRLIREIHLVAAATVARRVTHLHWGGGTPTMLGAEGLAAIVERLSLCFDLQPALDHAIELDPRQVAPGLAGDLARIGITRASLGVQDLNPHVQAAIGRIQPVETVAAAVAALRDAGLCDISFDLMYGLPGQTVGDVERSTAAALRLKPDRIALFGYAHVPWLKRHQRLIDETVLPGPVDRLGQEAAARAAIIAAGYEAIGLDHFALPGNAMAAAARAGRLRRNFQGYTTDRADALIGLGASAIGQLPQGFVQNAPDLAGYARTIDGRAFATTRGLRLTPEDRLRGAVIERLMCDLSADLDQAAGRLDADPRPLHADAAALAPLAQHGVVRFDGRSVTVPEAGRPYLRLVASAFDSHLGRAGRHSRAV
ncbi:Oxygen-independent coproporphyrinogen-III oxidase [bacterium YEK0313]|nr:Oxygen-independent coproporphyrinogen-III oxidase [bacterium YEK0313]